MNDEERIKQEIKQEIRHMIKSVGHAELEDMFGDVLAANYTTGEAANTVKRASRRTLRQRLSAAWQVAAGSCTCTACAKARQA